MLYLACHCSVKNPTLNAQRQWSKLPTSRLVESHSSLLCDNLPQRKSMQLKKQPVRQQELISWDLFKIDLHFQSTKRCRSVVFSTASLHPLHVRLLKLQPVYLERIFFASTRGPVVSTGSAVIRNGWSLAWKGSQSAKTSSPYFAQKIMTERSLQTIDFGITSPEVAGLIGCSAGQSHPDASEYALIKLSFPGFNTHGLTSKCSKSSEYHQAVSSRTIIVLIKNRCASKIASPTFVAAKLPSHQPYLPHHAKTWAISMLHKSHVDHGKYMIFPYLHDH